MKRQPKQQRGVLEKLSSFFYEKLGLSAVLWLSVFVFGVLSYTVFLQRQGFPQVNVPISVVQGVYFVNDKNQVDEKVTQPLLSSIKQVDSVKETRANSGDNQFTIIVEYEEGTNSQAGSDAIKKQIEEQKVALPENAQIAYEPIDAARFNNKYDLLLSVSGPAISTQELEEKANVAAQQLKTELPDAEVLEVVSPFEEATNPATGQNEKKQVTFDWKGEAADGEVAINPSIVIGVRLPEGTDIIGFDKKLQPALEKVAGNSELQNVNIGIAADFAAAIQEQINSLQRNLFEGLIAVIVICLIFIGVRAGLLAAVGMLMTLSATVGALYLFGLSLNTITLFGLVLCLGLIVDDTIIMVEAIDAQRKENKPLKEAVATAAKRVALASSAGTLTTMFGFAPLLFIGGILGEFIRVLPITIIISLAFSLLVSLFFIPFISRWFLNKESKQWRRNPINLVRRAETFIGDSLSGIITNAKTRRQKVTRTFIAVTISLAFILGTGPVFQTLKFDIFPTSKDSNAIQVGLSFAPGTTLDRANEITQDANERIKMVLASDLEKITYLGVANQREATAEITLSSYEEREETAAQLVTQTQEKLNDIEDARVVVRQVGAGPPKDQYPFRVQIDATNPEQAEVSARKLTEFLQDRKIERQNGTSAVINETNYSGEKVFVTRLDGKRIVEVQAGFDSEDTSALVQSAQELVEDEFLGNEENRNGLNKEAFVFDFGSESDNQDSFASVLVALPLLVLAMYLLLAIQFRSVIQPLLILVAVPFSFFGVGVALNLTDNPLSFFVMVGFFALIGISVNNSILLTDFANQGRRAGLSPRMAMAAAIRQRTRPLMTTSLTSIAALIPLALNDPFWESLAVTLIGGLAASTILVMLAFPYYYLALEAIRSRVIMRYRAKRNAER